MSETKQIKPYVDESYFALVPRPTTEQRKALKESIKLEGQHEPIIVDSTGRIIDGYTRFEICQELGIIPKFIVREFEDEIKKRNYAITVNLKRRHLNDFQIYELFEKQINEFRDNAKVERNRRIWQVRKGEVPAVDSIKEKNERTTAHYAMELTGLTVGVVEVCKYISNNADDRMKDSVRNGGIVFDICRTIKDVEKVRISTICRQANLSHYATVDYLNELEKAKLVTKKEEKKTAKRYGDKFQFHYWVLTSKGHEFFQKCVSLYDYLPNIMHDTIQSRDNE